MTIGNEFDLQPNGALVINRTDNIGIHGEAIAAQWVVSWGWRVLHHRWHCRWGELDLVACQPSSVGSPRSLPLTFNQQKQWEVREPTLVFIEVKTRTSKNWDANGLLAITPEKQRKLWQTAELFLAEFPDYAQFPCRFDLILVQYRRSPKQLIPKSRLDKASEDTHQLNTNSLVLPPFPSPQAQLGQSSQWVSIGNHMFKIEQHVKNIFEQ
ncbi:MAG: YraN family protein [Leptolyngbyaceae bacterium]|nr:YraN family protein [Leptolyngbyaceae bacterium]